MLLRALSLLCLGSLAACDTSSTSVSLRCDVLISSEQPQEAAAGDAVVLTGKPFTTIWDTSVYLDQTRALLLDLDRDSCDACDDCRDDYDCNACGDCDACDTLCAESCVETATFRVPALDPGAYDVTLVNVHGVSAPVPLTIAAPPETGETGAETGQETGAETGHETASETGAETGHETGPETGETGGETGGGTGHETGDTSGGDDTFEVPPRPIRY